MEDLIASYKDTRRLLRALHTLAVIKSDRKHIGSMLGNCSRILERLETGRYPKSQRAVNRLSYEQRTIYCEPKNLDILLWKRRRPGDDQPNISADQRRRIDAALNVLTDRERDCYIAAYGQGLPYSDVADLLQLNRSSVGTYIARAKKKIAEWKKKEGAGCKT